MAVDVIEELASQPVGRPATKQTQKAPKIKLSVKERKFVKAYVENGGNGTHAWIAAGGSKNTATAGTQSTRMLKKDNVRESILTAASNVGLSPQLIMSRVKDLVVSEDPWCIDRGITHSRAVLGLDAPTQQHIESRSMSVHVEAEAGNDILSQLLKSK